MRKGADFRGFAMNNFFHRAGRMIVAAVAGAMLAGAAPQAASAEPLAKTLFGAKKLPAMMPAKTYGFYSKGCFSGGLAIATDGPTWQAMRLSRNRRWGHPNMIRLLERFSNDATKIGWPGLLIGDISQPRGGPMLTGHASHQVGLDADIWFTPMPKRTLTSSERENISAVTMVKGSKKNARVDESKWTDTRLRLLKLAASYPQVERVFVNPAIKKKLCETAGPDRAWLNKVRPIFGHDYHFHIRMGCPAGSTGCKEQASTGTGDGCGKELAYWFSDELWNPPKPTKPTKPVKPQPRARDVMTMAALPNACQDVLAAPSPANEMMVTLGGSGEAPSTAVADAPTVDPDTAPAAASAYSATPSAKPPVPVKRPKADVGSSR